MRAGLSDDLRDQRTSGKNAAARVTANFRDELDRYTDETVPLELREQWEAARTARRNHGDRFERPGTAIAETLRPSADPASTGHGAGRSRRDVSRAAG